ncbi:hypothetical protein J7J35_00915 [Candidatus Bipolaricaulota bacterium]|nr:hypothetical protein [Candidatus Bipolaricaulota bacterium]
MEKERLSTLKAAIEAQLGEIDRVYERIEKRRTGQGPAYIESLAYQLHNLYCAYEDLFKIVAEYFENQIEDETRWHQELLWRMTLSIEGVRPALLSRESFRLLDSLRAFRHFFRHAYTYELDPRKVRLVLEDALAVRKKVLDDVHRFLQALGA